MVLSSISRSVCKALALLVIAVLGEREREILDSTVHALRAGMTQVCGLLRVLINVTTFLPPPPPSHCYATHIAACPCSRLLPLSQRQPGTPTGTPRYGSTLNSCCVTNDHKNSVTVAADGLLLSDSGRGASGQQQGGLLLSAEGQDNLVHVLITETAAVQGISCCVCQ